MLASNGFQSKIVDPKERLTKGSKAATQVVCSDLASTQPIVTDDTRATQM